MFFNVLKEITAREAYLFCITRTNALIEGLKPNLNRLSLLRTPLLQICPRLTWRQGSSYSVPSSIGERHFSKFILNPLGPSRVSTDNITSRGLSSCTASKYAREDALWKLA